MWRTSATSALRSSAPTTDPHPAISPIRGVVSAKARPGMVPHQVVNQSRTVQRSTTRIFPLASPESGRVRSTDNFHMLSAVSVLPSKIGDPTRSASHLCPTHNPRPFRIAQGKRRKAQQSPRHAVDARLGITMRNGLSCSLLPLWSSRKRAMQAPRCGEWRDRPAARLEP